MCIRDRYETTADVLWGDQIKRTTNVQEGSQAVGSRVDPLFDIVNQAGRGGLSRPIATKAMLLGVKGAKADTLINVPRHTVVPRSSEDSWRGKWDGMRSDGSMCPYRALVEKITVHSRQRRGV